MNLRRPTSTIRSQWRHGNNSSVRQYAYWRGFLGLARYAYRPERSLFIKLVNTAQKPDTTCRDVSTYSIIETLWLVTSPLG